MTKHLACLAHKHPAGSEKLHRLNPEEQIEITVHVKGPITGFSALMKKHGIVCTRAIKRCKTFHYSGTVKQFDEVFGIETSRYLHPSGATYRGHEKNLTISEDCLKNVVAILGLDNRPAAKPHFRRRDAQPGTFTPQQLAAIYSFPDSDGAGQAVGIIELGGGYMVRDLRSYLGAAAENVRSVGVDGGRNSPTGDPDGPDGEVELDVEIIAALVPAAKVIVYFADNTEQAFIDAVNEAIHDQTNNPGVISISWGGPEADVSQQGMAAWNQVLESSVPANVTILAASGDNGSSDGTDGNAVDFPASHPIVLGCGGTSLVVTEGQPNTRNAGAETITETVWNDGDQGGATGGGYSTIFPVPAYQVGLMVGQNGRGVPDVAGDADPQTGYQVTVDGSQTVVGGTSAVAPLWSALLTRINAITGKRCGDIHAKLYANPAVCRGITSGNNGAFPATAGWNPCCGLGVPIGTALLEVMQKD